MSASGHGLRRRVNRIRWETRARAAEHPTYLPLARRRHDSAVVSADTELVIDGFTRTAGTFAVTAFHVAQPRPVRVAHHLHAPAQILRAAELGVPTLLTIREPEGSVLSTVVRKPCLEVGGTLRAYVRFHRAVRRVLDRIVVADFDETTTDFGAVVARVNARFGTEFAPFEHTDANVATCFELIELRSQRPEWRRAIQDFFCGRISLAELREVQAAHPAEGGQIAENRVARPSEQRGALRERLVEEYRSARLARLRAEAEEVYLATAGTPSVREKPVLRSVAAPAPPRRPSHSA
jgi:hypothetical protein